MYDDNQTHLNSDPAMRQRIEKKRRRLKMFFYICNSFPELVSHPWKSIFLLLWIVAGVFAWAKRNALVFIDEATSPLIFSAFGYIVSALLITLFFLSLIGLLYLLGMPRKGKADENSLMVAFTAADLRAGCPFVIKRKQLEGGAIRREFYSKGISRRRWEERQEEILDALDCHLLEPVLYGGRNGNNRNRITLCTAHGYKPAQRGELRDDEL